MEDHSDRGRALGMVVATADAGLHRWAVRSAPAGVCVRGPAADGAGLVRLTRFGRVDVCLVDVRVPGGPHAVIATLADVAPVARTLAWAVTDDDPALLAALAAGAGGCLAGTPGGGALGRALDDLIAGRAPLPRALMTELVAGLRPA